MSCKRGTHEKTITEEEKGSKRSLNANWRLLALDNIGLTPEIKLTYKSLKVVVQTLTC